MSPYRLLRTVRKAVGLTQAEVASALGVSVKTVQRWEAGQTPSPRRGADLAAFVERLEVQLAGGAAPTKVDPFEIHAVYDEVVTTGAEILASDEPLPPGWRTDFYALLSFLDRAASGEAVFMADAEAFERENDHVGRWRAERGAADPYIDIRRRIIDLVARISASARTSWSPSAVHLPALSGQPRKAASTPSGRPATNSTEEHSQRSLSNGPRARPPQTTVR